MFKTLDYENIWVVIFLKLIDNNFIKTMYVHEHLNVVFIREFLFYFCIKLKFILMNKITLYIILFLNDIITSVYFSSFSSIIHQATTANGDIALHLAARRRDVDMVRILVDYGTNVDTQNGEGQTALHIAAAEGDEVLVKYFYGVRASAAITDNQDRTPMHLAAENGHANIIEILADKFRASIYERTKDGSTLMHIASLNGHSECATMLFKKGVYLHMPNKVRFCCSFYYKKTCRPYQANLAFLADD